MKINYNQNTMSNNVKRDIEYIKTLTGNALTASQSISIPADFNRKNDIYYTQASLAEAKGDLVRYIQWAEALESNFTRVEEINQSALNKIPNIEIKEKPKML